MPGSVADALPIAMPANVSAHLLELLVQLGVEYPLKPSSRCVPDLSKLVNLRPAS